MGVEIVLHKIEDPPLINVKRKDILLKQTEAFRWESKYRARTRFSLASRVLYKSSFTLCQVSSDFNAASEEPVEYLYASTTKPISWFSLRYWIANIINLWMGSFSIYVEEVILT